MNEFEKICSAMSTPAIYPHEAFDIQRRDTHISAVFLTGYWVYKLKKPVAFDFLDFRKLENRKGFCEKEVLLNKRLSSGIYKEVVGIYQDPAGCISLESKGRVVEYAVKMLQLPESENLGNLLLRQAVSTDQMESLGRMLAGFYEKTEQNASIDGYGRKAVIAYNMEENFREIEPFAALLADRDSWEFIRQVGRAFLEDHVCLFEHRIQTGRIRDGHGDLRADHIYFHDGIQIIDCIEFNDRFRYGDNALDLAFLHMDLDRLGHLDLGLALVAGYSKEAGDPQIYALIDFYCAYRAIVRLKIACLSYGQAEIPQKEPLKAQINNFMGQAYRYSVLFGRPTFWIFFGLPAGGKSTLADQAADALRIPVFRSDTIRKKDGLQSGPEVVAYNAGQYRFPLRNRVYGRLLALAQETLDKGQSVILDATFSRARWRQAARQLASDKDVNLIFVECGCSMESLVSRLKARENVSGESDARLDHLPDLIADFEPFGPEDPNTHVKADTERPLNLLLVEVLNAAYALKTCQVKIRIGENCSGAGPHVRSDP
jgi:uncharacterized protein